MAKGGRGKRKGSAFERDICKVLSLWVTGGKRDDVFWRSAMSGGRATVHGTAVRQAGDIAAVAPEGHALIDHYVIECKHYRDLQIASFVLLNRGKLAKFWKKVNIVARTYGKQPLLIAKQNAHPAFVVQGIETEPKITLLSNLISSKSPLYK